MPPCHRAGCPPASSARPPAGAMKPRPRRRAQPSGNLPVPDSISHEEVIAGKRAGVKQRRALQSTRGLAAHVGLTVAHGFPREVRDIKRVFRHLYQQRLSKESNPEPAGDDKV